MNTNRRSFIKMIGCTALSLTAGASMTEPLIASCPASEYVCILLHGLFFMAFKGKNLIVATPKFGHIFGMREQGDLSIGPLPPGVPDIDWRSVGLRDNSASKCNFPSSIAQFSAKDTGVGELLPSGNTAYQFQLILPRPDEIQGFREDHLKHFKDCTVPNRPKPPGLMPMRENIIKQCGSADTARFALLTGLIFKKTNAWKHKNVISFYAQHTNTLCAQNTAQQTNAALDAGKHLFATKENFDLCYIKPNYMLPAVCPDNECAYGVTDNDELSACELALTPPGCIQSKGTNPLNCAQYGVI